MSEREPTCPKCGYIFRDAWEMDFDTGLEGSNLTECGRCGIDLEIIRHITVSYNTLEVK